MSNHVRQRSEASEGALALETPEHIAGVELPGGFERVRSLLLDPAPQVEGVSQPVRADLPALRQAGHYVGRSRREIHQAIEDCFGRGIGRRRRGVLDDVEAFGLASV